MSSILRERLKEIMHARGLSAHATSAKAGLGASAVRDILSGKAKSSKLETVEKLAQALDCPAAYLAGFESTSIGGAFTISVSGKVARGVWREVGVNYESIINPPISHDLRYPFETQTAMIIGDNSLQPVASPDDILVCIDIAKSDARINDGDAVIVERWKDNGNLVETGAYIACVKDREIKRLTPINDQDNELCPGENISVTSLIVGVYRILDGARNGTIINRYRQ